MKSNLEIQQLVMDHVTESFADAPLDQGLRGLLFHDPSSTTSGLRLTLRGFAICEELFKYTTIKITNTGNMPFSTIIMNFNKCCHAPFYISTGEVKMFDNREAFLLQLMGGDLVRYFENKKNTEEEILA